MGVCNLLRANVSLFLKTFLSITYYLTGIRLRISSFSLITLFPLTGLCVSFFLH